MRRAILLLSAAVLVLSACGGDTKENERAGSATPSASASVTAGIDSPSVTDSSSSSPSPEIRTDYVLPPYDELVKMFDYDTSEPLGYKVASAG